MINFPVSQISNNPALVLSHFNEIIERRKAALFPEGAHDGVTEVLLLDRRDRPLYLASQVEVTQQEIEASYCERGITTTAHLREFIQLVHEISAACSTIAASELRSYHLDLLRAMKDEMVQKRA